MSVAAVRTPAEYESQLRRYLFERSEEGRAVRVGEKEVSERAEIVARYRDLFTREQLEALRAAEDETSEGAERERFYRLRKTCEAGVVAAEMAEREDALENAILAARIDFDDEELPLRAAQARLAILPEYEQREALGVLTYDCSSSFNDERLEVLRATAELEAEVSGEPDPVARNEEEKGISLRELEAALAQASERTTDAYVPLREKWFDRLLGAGRRQVPSHYHVAYLRRLSPLESTYTKERAVEICLDTVKRLGFDLENEPNIKLDVEDRPQKSPRACVIPSDPPQVVHLITRAQGGLHDYQAFLHEAGHALHYAGCDPELPYTFRNLSRDHALTEIYSYILEAITREPEWHAHYFGLADEQARENAEATTFLEALLFRRYAAKLQFELEFWKRFADDGGSSDGYAERLTDATGVEYRSDNYLADMDAGFYSADYLRAWIRSAQLRDYLVRELGDDWWRNAETGERLRALFSEGTRPSSEEVAARLGYDPLDTAPLLKELGA
jgi:Peptidase family M3